jgi:hypothetical protein
MWKSVYGDGRLLDKAMLKLGLNSGKQVNSSPYMIKMDSLENNFIDVNLN